MAAHFRLATLLKLRLDDRDKRRTELGQAHEAERLLVERLREIDEEIASNRATGGGAASLGEVNVEKLLRSNRYELVLRAQKQTTEQQRVKILAEIERRRALLVEADRQVKVLEKLQERQAEAAVAEELRVEAKELDEAALIGYRRREVDA